MQYPGDTAPRPNIKVASGFVIPGERWLVANNKGTSQNTYYTPPADDLMGKRGNTTFLDPFSKWPRKDAQSKGVKETWRRRFRRKPGRRGAPAAAGKKIYAAR